MATRNDELMQWDDGSRIKNKADFGFGTNFTNSTTSLRSDIQDDAFIEPSPANAFLVHLATFTDVYDYVVMHLRDKLRANDKLSIMFPIGRHEDFYTRLVELYKAGEISFRNATIFCMAEYVCDVREAYSYTSYLRDIFQRTDADLSNFHPPNPQLPGDNYEQLIEQLGGIDLFIAAPSELGQFGYHSNVGKGDTLICTMDLDTMSSETRFFPPGLLTGKALCVGVNLALKAKELIVLACGDGRESNTALQTAIKQVFEKPQNDAFSLTALREHPKCVFVAEKNAMKKLMWETVDARKLRD